MPTRTLRVVTGDSAGTSFEVAGEIVVGREGADLPLPDEQMSRRHAAVRSVDDGIEVEDLGSLNGTFVDGRRLEGAVTVRSTAVLRVGTTEISLVIEGPDPAVTEFRDIPPAVDATRAREIPDPDLTRAREIPDPDLTRAREIPDPDSTRARAIPVQQVTRAREIPDPDSTRARAIPVQQVTRARDTPAAPAEDQSLQAGGRSPLLFVAAAVAVIAAIVLLVLVL